MSFSIIVAVAENNVIGKDNKLLWHLPADLKFFKQTTLNHTMIMGRKTFDSIGKALPGRKTIVVTRQTDFAVENVTVAHSLKKAMELCKEETETFITGGAEIYKQSMPFVNKIYLTRLHQNFEGDTFFPEINAADFKLTSNQKFEPDEKNKIPFSIMVYERI